MSTTSTRTSPDTPTAVLSPSTSTLQCRRCGAGLAPDQRYCLNCGLALGEPRVDFGRALGLTPATETETVRTVTRGPGMPPSDRGPLMTVLVVATVVLAVGVGYVLGRGNASTAPGARTTVLSLGGAAPATPAAAASSATAQPVTSVSDDWPAGASGWTVEVASLDKSQAQASDVAAAKSAASAKGAPAVGALDGDTHSGTPAGKYVIYSGRYATQKQAQAALHKLGKRFPGALVLHVEPSGAGAGAGGGSGSGTVAPATTQGLSQASAVRHLTGSAYSKASAKLPSTVGTGGPPPPADNAKPGGGTGGTCIGC